MTSSINQGTRGRGRGMNRSMRIELLRKRPSDLVSAYTETFPSCFKGDIYPYAENLTNMIREFNLKGAKDGNTNMTNDRNLIQEIKQLRELKEDLGRENNTLRKSKDELEHMNKKMTEKTEHLGRENNTLRRSKDKLEHMNKKMTEKTEQLVQEIEQHKLWINYVESQKADMKKQIDDLSQEISDLRQRIKCKFCQESDLEVVLEPCGHLCCCQTCASRCDRCPICRAEISRRARTFLS
nr:E3 ubiquitin-protein ligase XIAP-like isoform X5 [Crassostrea gigas]